MGRWPVEIRPIGLAACGAALWRFRGRMRVTAVVKAAFSFVPGGPMMLEEPDDVFGGDVPFVGDPWAPRGLAPGAMGGPKDPTRSLWAASDLAPFRPQADVVLVGHARLPRGGGAVRLAVWSEHTLVDRIVQVADEEGDGAPIPLVYERALGGPRSTENPVGTGRVTGSRLPDLIDPADVRHPIGFGPIAPWWPVRAALLGGRDPSALAGPVAEIPGDIDWAYFQAAPREQRVPHLRGDEWIRIEGMIAEHPALETRLPGVTAGCRVFGLDASGPVPVVLVADGMHLDADRGRCSLTFRGSFAVPGEEALARLVLLAGVEMPGSLLRWPDTVNARRSTEVLEWPALPERASTVQLDWGEAGPPLMPAPEPPPAGRQATVVLAWPELPPPALDLDDPPTLRGRPSTNLLPAREAASMGVLEWPAAEHARQATVEISWGEGGPPGEAAGLSLWDDEHPLMATVARDEPRAASALSVGAPFHIAAPGSAAPVVADLPGAPWSGPAASAPAPADFAATVADPAPPPAVPAPMPAPPPALPAPTPRVITVEEAWPASPLPPEAPPAPPKPRSPSVPLPSAAVPIRRGLYGRFAKR